MSTQTTQIGLNKTGVQTSPKMTKQMKDASEKVPVSSQEHDAVLSEIQDLKSDYLEKADAIGTIPVPTTMKGMAKSGIQALKGNDPRIFIDKLGERLAFERSGVRLYDALITKCQAIAPDADVAKLKHFRAEEAQHFAMLHQCLEKIGADPTAMTPSADAIAVSSMGIAQVACDPSTTLEQTVQAVLTAEMVDNDGWELLIQQAQQAGLDDMVSQFQEALEQELEHLDHVRRWHQELVLKQDVSEIQ